VLNIRINDLMSQLNKTVQLLLDENKKLAQENTQLKTSSSSNPVKPVGSTDSAT